MVGSLLALKKGKYLVHQLLVEFAQRSTNGTTVRLMCDFSTARYFRIIGPVFGFLLGVGFYLLHTLPQGRNPLTQVDWSQAYCPVACLFLGGIVAHMALRKLKEFLEEKFLAILEGMEEPSEG